MNIAVILWKSGLLDSADSINLAKALPNGQATFASLNKLQRTNFSALQLLPFDYDIYNSPEVESTINDLKKELRDACLLHYYSLVRGTDGIRTLRPDHLMIGGTPGVVGE